MTKTKLLLSVAAASVLALNGCGGGSSAPATVVDDGTDGTFQRVTCADTDYTPVTGTNTLSGTLSGCLLLPQGKWYLDGKVQVTNGALKIESGSTVAGATGTNAWLEVMPSGQLIANNVTFTSQEEADGGVGSAGQWGGVTLIGADNKNEDGSGLNTQLEGYEVDNTAVANGTMTDSSGSITNCTFNNTGIAVEQDKEINGLSLVGVGSGTTISDITVNRSGDDAVEIWGGHVALTNVTISETGDDGFDTDDGWAGSVNHLTVSGATNSGLELSGTTHATYENVSIDTNGAVAVDDEGGAIYLKKTGIGGTFINITINHDGGDAQGDGPFVTDSADLANLSGSGIVINYTGAADNVTEGDNYDAAGIGTSATPQDVADALNITL